MELLRTLLLYWSKESFAKCMHTTFVSSFEKITTLKNYCNWIFFFLCKNAFVLKHFNNFFALDIFLSIDLYFLEVFHSKKIKIVQFFSVRSFK